MNTQDLIGQQIQDILVWYKMEPYGLDEGEVYLVLDEGKIFSIPWSFDSRLIEEAPKQGSRSIFGESKKRESEQNSIWSSIKKALYNIKYHILNDGPIDREILQLQYQKIVDFIVIEDHSVGFIVLENGCIITETMMAPHGLGRAGLNLYYSLEEFEKSYGEDYIRLSKS